MSTAFTPPAGQTWQTLLNEITLAYSERRQAIGQSAYTPVDGRDVQKESYWREFQAWLENNCVSFVDYENGPVTDEGDELLFLELDTWRAAAGLDANGFRRSVNGSSFSHGFMQARDIIGPWIFEDLQKGFSALKWTLYVPSGFGYRDAGRPVVFDEGDPPQPILYPDDVAHPDNPVVISSINNLLLPVSVYSLFYSWNTSTSSATNIVDDFMKIDGVMVNASRGSQAIPANTLLFSLDGTGDDEVQLEVFDSMGGAIKLISPRWVAKWQFTNA